MSARALLASRDAMNHRLERLFEDGDILAVAGQRIDLLLHPGVPRPPHEVRHRPDLHRVECAHHAHLPSVSQMPHPMWSRRVDAERRPAAPGFCRSQRRFHHGTVAHPGPVTAPAAFPINLPIDFA